MPNLKKWLTFRPWERHSLVLMISGVVYIAYGTVLLSAGELSKATERSLVIALQLFPLHVWGFLFVTSGLLSCLSSRWPSFSDSWGYMVLTGLSSAWSASYFLGFMLGGSQHTNLTAGAVWALLAFMWWAISGLVNPERRRKPRGGNSH